VVTTALIPNRQAMTLITEDMVASMRPASVVVDLAAAAGGNCALTRPGETVTSPNGVVVIGELNYPSQMAAVASEMLGSNFTAMLETLGGAEDFGGEHWEDPVVLPATVARGGQVLWPPPPPPVPPEAPAISSGSSARPGDPPTAFAPRIPSTSGVPDIPPELAFAIGTATVVGLGITTSIPEDVLTQLGFFVLSLLIGNFVVSGVAPALHTPLISVTNAISGVIVVGGMMQLDGDLFSPRVSCALAAVFLSAMNIIGGFAVTQRMLEMFREDGAKPTSGPGGDGSRAEVAPASAGGTSDGQAGCGGTLGSGAAPGASA